MTRRRIENGLICKLPSLASKSSSNKRSWGTEKRIIAIPDGREVEQDRNRPLRKQLLHPFASKILLLIRAAVPFVLRDLRISEKRAGADQFAVLVALFGEE